jgi:uncharacterized protein (DUF58 family)
MPIDHFKAQRFGRLELLAKQAVEGYITGMHKSPYHGFSVEFAEHRAYNTGESTRHIDWKLYGRTDKMFVKRFEEETNLRCNVIIDRSGSMYYPQTRKADELNKIQFGIQSAASLIYLMRSQRDAVGLTLFGKGIELSTPAKSSLTHQGYLFNELEKIYDLENGSESSDIVNALHMMAEKTHKRSLIVVISDFMDTLFRNNEDQSKLFEALQHLRYNKHEVILFHLFDHKTELDLDLENRPYTFVDLETGEKIKVQPIEIKEQYKALKQKRIQEVKLTCRQYGIDWNEIDIQEGVSKVLDRFLAKRSRLG